MRITDAFQTVPGFLLALAFVSVVGPSLGVIVLAIALSALDRRRRASPAPKCCRSANATMSQLRRVIGMRPLEIAFREVLPNALPPVLALSSVIVAAAILTEAALSFLGLGDPNRVTWGGMIAEGRTVLRTAPFLSIVPGIALVLTVLGRLPRRRRRGRSGGGEAQPGHERARSIRDLAVRYRRRPRREALHDVTSFDARRGRAAGGDRRKRLGQVHAGAGDCRPAAAVG